MNFWKRIPISIFIFTLIIFVGIFFRTYHFHDFLQFKGDAFRDALLVSNVYDTGIESLPLLGPRAGGTMLRLGPIFYDFQYIAVSLFRSLDAPVLTYPDLLFSILSLPLFFFFVRRFFSLSWSLVMMSMLSTSFLAIEYGRFAWNPNSVLFFTLLFSYATLRLFDDDQEKKHPLIWASISGIALAIASQLHFSAFLGLPLVLFFFVLLNRKKSRVVLTMPVLVTFFLSILVLSLPIVISEFFKHGENARLFLSAISSKSSSNGFFFNIYQDLHMFAKYFARILVGLVEPSKKIIILGGIFCGIGFLSNILLLRSETDEKKKNFLQWSFLLFIIYFILYIPLAFKIDRPRFYLPFMMLPFLYFGYILLLIEKKEWLLKYQKIIAFIGICIIVGGNSMVTLGFFSELRASEQTQTSTGERNSKGRSFFLTWGHFKRAADVIDQSCEEGNDIYFQMAKNIKDYDHSFEYALLLKKRNQEESLLLQQETKQDGCYYFISFAGEALSPYLSSTIRDTSIDIGNIDVTRIYPEGDALLQFRENKITVEREWTVKKFEPEKVTRYSRVFWGDVFSRLQQ